MNTFKIFASYGPLEISEDSGVVRGDAYIYTIEGNRHTVWAPKSLLEALKAGDAVLALGETPHGITMNPIDWSWLKGELGLIPGIKPAKKVVCECGSAKAKTPFHSSWCPVKS